jgi:hypothetical protein
MIKTAVTPCLVAAILVGLVACASAPTTLRVDTDPQGADVESPQIGFLGTTPLVWKFTGADLAKVAPAGNLGMSLDITKRGYVTISGLRLSFEKGTTHNVKKILDARLSEVAITSDPGGVAVFQLVMNKGTMGTFKATAANKQVDWVRKNPMKVTQRFLGATPTAYQYDPDNKLENNEPLLFTKTGFVDQIVYFKVSQERLHGIMQPTK